MSETKYYEMEDFHFEFTPNGGTHQGTLVTRIPETEPYAAEINLPKILSRDRYAKDAAQTWEVEITSQLIKDLKVALNSLCVRRSEEVATAREAEEPEEREENLASEPGSERHERAMELLTDSDILKEAARTMELLGHVGEWLAKMLAFICAISARAGYPIQPSTHAESSTGKNYLWDTVLLLLPPEKVIKRSAMSDKALFRTEADLRGAVLYLQEVAGSEGADFAIRVMQSAQYLEYEATEKMPDGSLTTVVHRKEGPVVVVQTTTAIRLYHENDTRVFPIYLDESVEQTQRIVENAKKQAKTGGISPKERESILEVWHDAIRLLEPTEVIIPYAERIEVPVHRVRVRRDIGRILDVIRVLAWLHQHERERDEEGRILATEDDFHAAVELVADSLERAWQSLTPAEQAVMQAIASLSEAKRRNGFRRNDLEVEGHDKRRVQDALKALTETGYLESERKGGPGGYRYIMSRDPESKGLGISLRTPGGDGEDGSEGPDADVREKAMETGPIDENEDEEGESPEEDAEYDSANNDLEDPEEEDRDDLGELTELGWFRAQTDFVAEEYSKEDAEDEDPVVHKLRHRIPIYQGWYPENCNDDFPDTPLAVTAEDVFNFNWETKHKSEEELRSDGWPATPEEMDAHLKRIIPLMQRGPLPFYNPDLDAWYSLDPDAPQFSYSPEKLCKPAYLHAERWVNEETSEEIWALTALREGWRPPDKAIEGAVLLRLTSVSSKEYTPKDLEDLPLGDEDDDFVF